MFAQILCLSFFALVVHRSGLRPLWPNSISLSFLSGSDGLVKLWTIKTNECVKTFDAHQDKVWALHGSSKDDLMVTGSADSTITLWKVSPPHASYPISFSTAVWQNTVMKPKCKIKHCELCFTYQEKWPIVLNCGTDHDEWWTCSSSLFLDYVLLFNTVMMMKLISQAFYIYLL